MSAHMSARSSAGLLWFCIYINFQCEGPASRYIYPHTWVRRTPVSSSWAYMSFYISVYTYFHLSVSMSGHLCHFMATVHAARNGTHRMRPQATGSNILSGSMICPSVHLSIRTYVQSSVGILRFLYLYLIVLLLEMITITITITRVGSRVAMPLLPVGLSRDFMSISLSFWSSA